MSKTENEDNVLSNKLLNELAMLVLSDAKAAKKFMACLSKGYIAGPVVPVTWIDRVVSAGFEAGVSKELMAWLIKSDFNQKRVGKDARITHSIIEGFLAAYTGAAES